MKTKTDLKSFLKSNKWIFLFTFIAFFVIFSIVYVYIKHETSPSAQDDITVSSAISAVIPEISSALDETSKTEAVSSNTEETKTTTTTTTTSVSVPKPADNELVRVKDYIPEITVDLKYAKADNFTKQKIYDFNEAYLRFGTVKKLQKAHKELSDKGYNLKIWDAFRPYSAQCKLWEICPNPAYVSDPSKGHLSHCRGNAVDLTLVKKDGTAVKMPTDFDDFTPLADRNYSDISDSEAVNNALLLEECMERHGLKGYSGEWWHFADSAEYPIEKEFIPR